MLLILYRCAVTQDFMGLLYRVDKSASGFVGGMPRPQRNERSALTQAVKSRPTMTPPLRRVTYYIYWATAVLWRKRHWNGIPPLPKSGG